MKKTLFALFLMLALVSPAFARTHHHTHAKPSHTHTPHHARHHKA